MRLPGLALVLLIASASSAAADVTVRRARYVMGTVFEITARGADESRAIRAVEAAFAEIRRSDEVLSHYRSESDLSRLNRARAGERLRVDRQLSELLLLSARLTTITDGAFRITIAPLVELWNGAKTTPSAAARAEAVAQSRTDCYEVLEDGNVWRARPGCRIEFGAIGKGWAVDRAVGVLKRHGVEHALVSAGTSTIFAFGDDGQADGWPVAVRDPRDEETVVHEYLLMDAAVSTSANYGRLRSVGGREYGHIIDPRDGWPADEALSATVIAPTGAEADALSTSLFVLGVEEGAKLLSERGRVGFVVASDGTEHSMAAGDAGLNQRVTAVGWVSPNPPAPCRDGERAGWREYELYVCGPAGGGRP